MHTYGKTGQQLFSTLSGLNTSVNAIRTPASRPLPIVVTEHASHTAADWNGIQSTADNDFEASRLASQLLWQARTQPLITRFGSIQFDSLLLPQEGVGFSRVRFSSGRGKVIF